MFTPLADVLTRKLKIVAYKTKGRGVLLAARSVDEYQQWLKNRFCHPERFRGLKLPI